MTFKILFASVAEWMRNEMFHFSSVLRAIANRLVNVNESEQTKGGQCN
ncbi:MAG: hypothetical protein H6782_00135 [Candidatus Nomurabacteria bacterium]|nr:MAG: hypothetical protein H6782_00135 [Candidatus Nomurabacteria bacterium]